jgi:hypothetical protein
MPLTSHHRYRLRGKSPHLEPVIYYATRKKTRNEKIPGAAEYEKLRRNRENEKEKPQRKINEKLSLAVGNLRL